MRNHLATTVASGASVLRTRHLFSRLFSLVLVLALFNGPSALAQVLFGSMVGNVNDATGAGVPEAKVKITETSTNNVFNTTTNESGGYTVANLPGGTYSVEISKEGFRTFLSSNILVNQNNVVRIDASLQIGSQQQTVEVTAEAAALQTDRADVHSEVAAQQLLNVPQPNRNYQTMLVMVPGVTPPGGQIQGGTNNPSRSSQFSFNGQGTQAATVRIEGVSARNPWVPQYTTFVPSVEAIENVNVTTNAADAEQGLAGGASVNVRLKSGTNETHGAAFIYNIGSYAEAQNFFAPAGSKVPHLVNNMAGGSVGGHIIRNKLFYFGSYDGDYLRSAVSGLLSMPNAATLSGDFSGSPNPIYDPRTGTSTGTGRTPFAGNRIPTSLFDPVVAKLLPYFPSVTYQNLTQNNNFVSQGQVYNLHKIDTKVDYTATSKLRVSGRYGYQPYYNKQDPIYGQFLGGTGGFSSAGAGNYLQNGATLAVSASATYIVSPTFVLDATFGATQAHQLLFPTNSDTRQGADLGIPGANTGPLPWSGGLPRFNIANYVSFGYSYPALEYKDPIFEYAANGTKTAGRHTIRFGADILREHQNHIEVRETQFTFNGGITSLNGGPSPNQFNSVADFLLGRATNQGNYLQFSFPLTLRTYEMAYYVRDQFQVSRKLTANYGVRWEYYPVPTQENQQLSSYDPATNIISRCGQGSVPKNCGITTSKKLFAPSIGIAYRPFEDFVIRVGYSLSPQTDSSMGRQSIQSYPDEAQSTINGPNSFTQSGTVSVTGAPVIPQPVLVDGKIAAPAGTGNIFFNPQNFIRGYFQSYNFTLEKAFKGNWTAQVGYVGSHAVKIANNYNINYGLPNGGASSQLLNKYGITAVANENLPAYSGKYNSLQSTIRKRTSAGLSLNLSFTYQHDISNLPPQTVNVFIPQYFYRNYTTSSIDRTFSLYIGGGYELPFGKGKPFLKTGVAAWVLGGWQTNWLFSHFSGSPFNVTSSTTSCNCPGLNVQTANQVLPTVDLVGRGVGGTSYFNPLAYRPVTTPTLGTAGYYQLRGPGATNLDFSVFRDFRVTERIKLQFRAEALNLSNTPHFANPNANVSNATFSNATNSFTALNGFSQITQTAVISRLIDPRYFRFGFRIMF